MCTYGCWRCTYGLDAEQRRVPGSDVTWLLRGRHAARHEPHLLTGCRYRASRRHRGRHCAHARATRGTRRRTLHLRTRA